MKTFKTFLAEAIMTGKATDGRTNVQKYLVDNPKALDIDWEFEKSGEVNGMSFMKGQKFKLKSKKVYELDGKPALDTSIGVIPIRFIKKPSGFKAMSAEIIATSELNELVKKATKENNSPVNIKIGKFIVKNVVAASSSHIKGTPKADITFLDENGKEVGFVSHKKAGGAKGFQQYGGITKQSGLKHKEIDDFTAAVYKDAGKSAPKGYAVYREVKDKKLINQSVYGPDYPGSFGRENCHCIGQGSPILVKKGKYYELDFSENIHYNGDIKWAQKGKFLAVFGCTYRSGRKVTSEKGTTKNARAGIYPIAVIQSRKALKEI